MDYVGDDHMIMMLKLPRTLLTSASRIVLYNPAESDADAVVAAAASFSVAKHSMLIELLRSSLHENQVAMLQRSDTGLLPSLS